MNVVTTEQYQQLLKKLNTQQRDAVESIEGAVMVIAGPGTGKTQVLTLRIANILLKTQINPENILALTFTDSAVFEMRKRLSSIIGTPAYEVDIYTFHGFCNDLIRYSPEDFSTLISSNNINELEQIQIVENIIHESELNLLKPVGDPLYYVKPSLKAIDELKKDGISPEIFYKSIEAEEEEFSNCEDIYHEKGVHKGKMKSQYLDMQKSIAKNKELYLIYKKYQTILEEKKQYDFNDMLLEVIKCLENNNELLLRLQEKYQYFLVDEHQDTNAAQNKIIELLCSFFPNPNLFVVGDEKQAIFRFQGASLENFLYFRKLYPDAKLIHLSENYRSTQIILDAAHSLIDHNIHSHAVPSKIMLNANAPYPQEQIKIIACNDFYAEYYFLAEDIKEKLKRGVKPYEIAVLARNNRDLDPCINVFEQLSIPYVIESDQNILQHNEIKKIILLFRTIYALGSDRELVEAMHLGCFNIDPLDIYRLMQLSNKKKIPLWDIISNELYKDEIVLKSEKNILDLTRKLFAWKKASYNETFDTLFISVLNTSGILASILRTAHSADALDKVTGLYENIKLMINKNANFDLNDFIHYIDLLTVHQISIKKSVKTIYKNSVRLMTTHKSKGLEFDYVYIINAIDGHWGNQRKRSSGFTIPWRYLRSELREDIVMDKNEDERRLFYVAITRARKEILISYSNYGLDGKEQVPSQFLGEIDDSYKELLAVEQFETNFLKDKQKILNPKIEPNTNTKFNEYKEFVSKAFVQKGFSVSALNNYLTCPWQYFFRNLVSLPDTKEPSAKFGTAIHKALGLYINSLEKEKLSLEMLVNEYYLALEEEGLKAFELAKFKERGKVALEGYYKQVASKWEKGLISEYRVKGVKLSENIFLSGNIDMIEPIKNKDVIVYDFKTGKPKSRKHIEGSIKNSDGNYKRQLVFYKLLLDKYQNGNKNMTVGVIDFIEPTESGNYQRELFEISPDEVIALEALIMKVTDEILSLEFWDKTCDDEDCYYCSLKRYLNN